MAGFVNESLTLVFINFSNNQDWFEQKKTNKKVDFFQELESDSEFNFGSGKQHTLPCVFLKI